MVKELITMDMPIEDIYHDYKLVADSITDDKSFQKADAGILLSNLYDVVKVLEKQIPRKLDIWNGQYSCPNCNRLFGNKKDIDTTRLFVDVIKYCNNCGQAIKWE